MSNLENILNFNTTQTVDNIAGLPKLLANSPELFTNFQKFRKLLGQCSATDDMSVNGILQDMKTIILDGYKDSVYYNNPEKIACFATAILGLSTVLADEIKTIYQHASTYKKGFIPKFESVLTEVYKEYKSEVNVTQTDNIIPSILDLGSNYLLDIYETEIAKGADWAEEKAKMGLKKLYSYLSFMLTVSSEFKWIVYLIYIENLKTEIDKRCDKLSKLRESFSLLIYDINLANKTADSTFTVDLQNYAEALTRITDSIFYNDIINKKLIDDSVFDTVLSDSLIGTLDDAKTLLVGQRNEYLESILSEEVVEKITTVLNNTIILPNDITHSSSIFFIDSSSTHTNTSENILRNLIDIESVFCTTNSGVTQYVVNDVLETEANLIWLETKTMVGSGYVLINDRVYEVIQKNDIEINKFKFTATFSENEVIHLLQIKPIDTKYHTFNLVLSNGVLNEIIAFKKDIDYTTKVGEKIIKFTEDIYEVIEEPNEILNTIILNQNALDQIVVEWGSSTAWTLRLQLKFGGSDNRSTESYAIYALTGDFPSFMETNTTNATNTDEQSKSIFSELPEPLKSIFSKYKEFDYTRLSSYLSAGSELSQFLYGRDLINDSVDKYGNYLLAYSGFIKTANNVLESFCPLKNTIFSFYSLLEQIDSFKETDELMAQKVNRDWILKMSDIMSATMRLMTMRDGASFEFKTIEKVKNSYSYSELIPSMILDHQNISSLKHIAEVIKKLGDIYNKNNEVQTKFIAFYTLVDTLKENDTIAKLKKVESEMWSSLGATFVSSLELLIKGESIESLKTIFDSIEYKIDDTLIELQDLKDQLVLLNTEGYESQKYLIDLFENLGTDFIVDFMKQGKLEKFIYEDSNKWMGKHGETIDCLTKLANKYFFGVERNYLLSIANFIKSQDIGRLLTILDVEKLNTNMSININFLNNVASETINDIKSAAKKASHINNGIKTLRKKEAKINSI
jgi:hypothetical protein